MADPSPGVAADAPDLTAVERVARKEIVGRGAGYITDMDTGDLRVLMAEYDRRGVELERLRAMEQRVREIAAGPRVRWFEGDVARRILGVESS
jgi:hypothetical protein